MWECGNANKRAIGDTVHKITVESVPSLLCGFPGMPSTTLGLLINFFPVIMVLDGRWYLCSNIWISVIFSLNNLTSILNKSSKSDENSCFRGQIDSLMLLGVIW